MYKIMPNRTPFLSLVYIQNFWNFYWILKNKEKWFIIFGEFLKLLLNIKNKVIIVSEKNDLVNLSGRLGSIKAYKDFISINKFL